MTEEQFELLAKFMRADLKSNSCRAAKLILINGYSNKEAQAELGCSKQAVHRAVKRYNDAYSQFKTVFGQVK